MVLICHKIQRRLYTSSLKSNAHDLASVAVTSNKPIPWKGLLHAGGRWGTMWVGEEQFVMWLLAGHTNVLLISMGVFAFLWNTSPVLSCRIPSPLTQSCSYWFNASMIHSMILLCHLRAGAHAMRELTPSCSQALLWQRRWERWDLWWFTQSPCTLQCIPLFLPFQLLAVLLYHFRCYITCH